jgi:hypothetical protein
MSLAMAVADCRCTGRCPILPEEFEHVWIRQWFAGLFNFLAEQFAVFETLQAASGSGCQQLTG